MAANSFIEKGYVVGTVGPCFVKGPERTSNNII
jgi:hypothetical protein